MLSRDELELSLGLKFNHKNILVTFHPVTLENDTAEEQMHELLDALDELENTSIIFTLPNPDTGGLAIIELIKKYVSKNVSAHAFTSLGQHAYLSTVAQVDIVVGNSSSGIIEVPSLRKGTLNIGDRQAGRLQAESIINCLPEKESILEGIGKLYSVEFQSRLANVHNPYGDGLASEKVLSMLKTAPLDDLLKKKFHDL